MICIWSSCLMHTNNKGNTRLTAFCPGIPGKPVPKGKTNLDLLEQERVSGSGISWVTCKSFAHRPRQITMSAHHHSVFTGRMPFLPLNQQCQSNEGILLHTSQIHNQLQYNYYTKQLSLSQKTVIINCVQHLETANQTLI